VERSSSQLADRRVLADGDAIASMLDALAARIAARHAPTPGAPGLALVGIRTGGLHLARRLAERLRRAGLDAPVGAVDIALYRDDVFSARPRPEVGPTELPFALAGVHVLLVDDVLYTGRTVRAALDALWDWGRPRAVGLAVLVDRGLRELPIAADFVGMTVATTADQRVRVELAETGDADQVVVGTRPGAAP
jgi:pyrimidine operon attenuation protein/uracil phosphoribosyltransferase